jgi:hypothetical protein
MRIKYFFAIICFLVSQVFEAQNSLIWAQQYGGSDSDAGYAITLDSKSNVYTTGYFQYTADFDRGPGTYTLDGGNASVFLTKTDASGNFQWAIKFTGRTQNGTSLVVDNNGNIYLTGVFVTTVDFDPGAGTYTITSKNESFDCFVCKLDSMGNLVWARAFGGKDWDESRGIALDSQGSVYTTGFFKDTVDFDPGTGVYNLVSAGKTDVFITKLDNNGNFIWAGRTGGSNDDWGNSITYYNNGSIIYSGFFSNYMCDLDPGPNTTTVLASHGSTDAFITKVTPMGQLSWVRIFGGSSADQSMCVRADSSGNIYSSGCFQGTADFDPGPSSLLKSSLGINDAYVLKLNSLGNLLWAKTFGSSKWDFATSLFLDSQGNSYVTGAFSD